MKPLIVVFLALLTFSSEASENAKKIYCTGKDVTVQAELDILPTTPPMSYIRVSSEGTAPVGFSAMKQYNVLERSPIVYQWSFEISTGRKLLVSTTETSSTAKGTGRYRASASEDFVSLECKIFETADLGSPTNASERNSCGADSRFCESDHNNCSASCSENQEAFCSGGGSYLCSCGCNSCR